MQQEIETLRTKNLDLEHALHQRSIEFAGLEAKLNIELAERIQLESRLREAQTFESFARMAGTVTVEFNNLLAVVKGYSELMQDQIGDNPVVQSEIREVMKAVDRASALVKQMIALHASAVAGR